MKGKKNEDLKLLLPVESLLCVSGVCSPYLVEMGRNTMLGGKSW